MFYRLSEIQDYSLRASDGEFGEIRGFIIDDLDWQVRYMVVQVGSRYVLLAPRVLGQPDVQNKTFPVTVGRAAVMNSPEIDPELKLSREMERRLADHFEWPYYWDADDVPTTSPGDLTAIPLIDMQLEKEAEEQEQAPQANANGEVSHLRNTREIFGYTVHAANDDANAGRLEDLVVNGEDWSVLYMVIDSGGQHVLVAPAWVKEIDEMDSRIAMDLSSETIRSSPPFATIADLTPDYQNRLNQHYGR